MSEKELVRNCVKGNLAAQKQLYIDYAPKMMGICMRYASCTEEAEDMLQEAFIRVYTKIHSFKNTGPLGAWVRKVVVNTAAEIYRKEKKYAGNNDIENHLHSFINEDFIIERLAADDLLEKIQRLPKGYRIVFNLYAIEGYSHKEIANRLNISENTSKSQYCRARATIRKMIENERLISEKAV